MNLKTKSHGKNEQRQLVVYKVLTLQEILGNLLLCGGENEKYSLRYPQGAESSNSSASSNRVIVDKENPNVSVRTVSTDSTKDMTTLSSSESKNEPQNISQWQEVSVEKSIVPWPGSVNKDPESVDEPETVFLSSDDDIDSQNKLQDIANYKKDAASGALEVVKEYDLDESDIDIGVDESDIDVINRVIDMKKEEIITLQTGFEELLDIYNKKKFFTPKQRRKYIISRRKLQNLTGTFILNVLQPKWTIEDWKCGKIPKNDSLNNFGMRSEAAGLAEVENNVKLKLKIVRSVKRKLKADKLIESKQTRKAIKLECGIIGSKLVSDFLYFKKPIPEKRTNDECIGIKRKVTRKAKRKQKQNFSKKKNYLNSKTPRAINFVKESGKVDDELSGMEYSDVEFDLND